MPVNPYRSFSFLLSENTKEKGERVILIIAIFSFVIHLALIYLNKYGVIQIESASELLKSPITAIYTPFSFILVYEVYLLIFYLPQSITTYIRKQYEIITLIVIRRIFKDLGSLELSSNWFEIKYDLQFTYDIIASILLFGLLYLFHAKSRIDEKPSQSKALTERVKRFVKFKKLVALILVPVLIGLAVYTFGYWALANISSEWAVNYSFKNVNNVFFDEFFTLLIIVDVILLLVSFFHTHEFHKVIRNSGFIISTILIRLSFSVDGIINTVLIITAVLFGLFILIIHNQYEKNRSKLHLDT